MSTTPRMPTADVQHNLQDLVQNLFEGNLAVFFNSGESMGSSGSSGSNPGSTGGGSGGSDSPTATDPPTTTEDTVTDPPASGGDEGTMDTPPDPGPATEAPPSGDEAIQPPFDGPVSFSATLSGDSDLSFQSSDGAAIVRFDQVMLNAGDGYDPSTGVFTSPRAGVYVFTLDLKSAPGKLASARIVKNTEVLHYVRANGQSTGEIGVGSGTVATSLSVGDIVFVCVVSDDGDTEILPLVTRLTAFRLS